MRTATHCCLTLAIMLLLTPAGFTQEEKPDTRLDQHVTVDCVNVRLHTVLEQLADQTDVRLNCGRKKDDWQVRDIPVTVCVKDLPLGTVLQTIADATHLTMTSEKAENERSYRIWRDRKRTLELTDYLDKRKAWADDTARWQWDTACKFKDIPAATIDAMKDGYDKKALSQPENKQLSKILTLLGNETRERVLAGERVRITEQEATGQLKTLIDQYMQDSWQSAYNNYMQYRDDSSPDWTMPSTEDFQKCALVIQCPEVSGNNSRYIDVHGEGPVSLNSSGLSVSYTMENSLKDSGIPKRPEQPQPPDSKTRFFTGDFWEKKISLEPPKGKEPVAYGTLLRAAAVAAGYSLILEDFHTHLRGSDLRSMFKADTTLREAVGYYGLSWSVDEKNKLMVGSETDWPNAHLNLVPGQILDDLKRKLNGEGVEFDDVTPIAYWNSQQVQDWIANDKDVYELGYPSYPETDKPIWQFYDGLSPAQKAEAKSEAGLPVGTTDFGTLSAIYSERNRRYSAQYSTTDENGNPATWSWQMPVDAPIVASSVLHVRTDSTVRTAESVGPVFHSYRMEITWQKGSGTSSMSFYGPGIQFPKYTQKREKELTEPKPPAAQAKTGP